MNDTSSRFFQKEKRLISYRCVELLLAVIFIDASVISCDVPQAIQYRVEVGKRRRNLPFSSSSAAVYLMPARSELILAGTKKTDHPFDPYSIHYIGSWREKASKKKGTRITQLIHIPFITSCCGENKFTEKKGKIIVSFTHIPLIISCLGNKSKKEETKFAS